MRYPMLGEMQTSRDWLEVFLGYNHNTRIGSGEFYNMTNLTGDEYPVLAPRKQRGYVIPDKNGTKLQFAGLIGKDALCHIEDGKFYVNNAIVDNITLTIDKDENNKIIPKTLISMGLYVIILPDKKWVNTKPSGNVFETGTIEEHFVQTKDIAYEISRLDGNAYANDEVVKSITEPEVTEAMLAGTAKIPIWVDISSTPHTIKQYSTSNKTWTSVATTYVKINHDGIGTKFEVGDAVTISGAKIMKIGVDNQPTTEERDDIKSLNGSFIIMSKGDNFIVITGFIDEFLTQSLDTTNPFRVDRTMPDMDFVVEANNRLWGCKYGVIDNADGTKSVVNEIYASKLGDFKNWRCYQGIASDSYAVTVGTDGRFTGAVTYLGYPIFFKEDYAHKIYGSYPANYQVQTTALRGVQEGCHKSLVIVNEVLYYKARSAFVAYTGSLPTDVSGALGDVSYKNAVAGHLGNKYYVSMEDGEGEHHMFTYDTKKGLWHREDSTEASDFCNCRGNLYFINRSPSQIQTVIGAGDKAFTNPIEWEAETGYLGTDTPDKKYISRLDVRMQLAVGSTVTFYAEYDSSGEWEFLFSMVGKSLQSFSVPVRPKRCDHLRLKMVGEGDAKIFSICKTIEWGSSR